MTLQIATIVPTLHLSAVDGERYKMSLAHLANDPAYAGYFSYKGRNKPDGVHIIMDNGVIEVGTPYTGTKLWDAFRLLKPDEVILPDYSTDPARTRHIALETIGEWQEEFEMHNDVKRCNYMYVPHGNTPEEWMSEVQWAIDNLTNEVKTIGISRLVVPRLFANRLEALESVPKLIESIFDIHLLGCPGHPNEIYQIEQAYPHRIRGVDSGIASIYTQAGVMMRHGHPKPDVELHFDQYLDPARLWDNITVWRNYVRGAKVTG